MTIYVFFGDWVEIQFIYLEHGFHQMLKLGRILLSARTHVHTGSYTQNMIISDG